MPNFGLLVVSDPSHPDDIGTLVSSYRQHAQEGIPLYVVTSRAQADKWAELAGGGVELLVREDVLTGLCDAATHDTHADDEVIKLGFWELGRVVHYLSLRPSTEFVRDFGVDDFMVTAGIPYAFLTEDPEMRVEPIYFREQWPTLVALCQRVQQEVGLETDRILTAHGDALLAAPVLRSLKDDFLAPRGWTYRDAIACAPAASTWYSTWLLANPPFPVVMREPNIKVFYTGVQHLDYVLRGISPADIARGYVGVARSADVATTERTLPLGESPYKALAALTDSRDLIGALRYRLHRQVIVEKTPYRRARTRAGLMASRVPALRRYVDLGEPEG